MLQSASWMRHMVLASTVAHMSVTAIMGVVVAATRTQGGVAVIADTVTAEIGGWVGQRSALHL